VQPTGPLLRQTSMRAALRRWAVGAVFVLLVAGCGSASESGTRDASSLHLSGDELAKALTAAREEANSEDAQITAATATAAAGTVPHPNTNYECSSGRLLRITLIGSFPDVVTTGPVPRRDETKLAAAEVNAMLLTADAATGRICEIGVQTGTVRPDPDATVLDLS
jgi:hypothetical protein